MENPNESAPPVASPVGPVDLGAWIGQTQAFGLLANRCSTAQADCLKRIRESRSYETLGLTWEQFCRQHTGISRSHADDLIRNLDEFGDRYFQLSGIARLSPELYRLLAPAVSDEGIEIDGEIVPITPENAPRIRLAVQALRAELRSAQVPAQLPSITELKRRFDACFQELSILAYSPLDPGTEAAWRGMIHYGQNKLKQLSRTTPPSIPR